MNLINSIEIKNIHGKVIYNHNLYKPVEECNIDIKDLRGAYLIDADLSCANLRDTDLTGVILTGAVLMGAVLEGADLSGEYLRGAKYTQEQMNLAITDEATIF